jgi:hypothetical protein
MGIVWMFAEILFGAPIVWRIDTVLAIVVILGVHSARWHALSRLQCPASVPSIVQLQLHVKVR